MPDFVNPERIKSGRAFPSARLKVIPGRAQQAAVEILQARGVLGKNRGFERSAQRTGEPLAQRDGKTHFRAAERFMQFAREAMTQDELARARRRELER